MKMRSWGDYKVITASDKNVFPGTAFRLEEKRDRFSKLFNGFGDMCFNCFG